MPDKVDLRGRPPTEKQYRMLLQLASGSAGLSWRKRDAEQLLRRSWVTAEWRPPYYQWVRITAEGLRALALAVERYGLPELNPSTTRVQRRICADCGSHHWRTEQATAEEAMAA